MKTAIFNRFTLRLPDEAVTDCSHEGDCWADCRAWSQRKIVRPRECTIQALWDELRDYGAWSGAELANDRDNWVRIIWLAACQVKEDLAEQEFSRFNPDAFLVPGDCDQWLEWIGRGLRPEIARRWFPGRKGASKAVRLIRCYLWNKRTAMILRLEGKIRKAAEYEAICERIYGRLPDWASW